MARELGASQLFFTLCAGVLPALIWLWFWLREDRKRPEPRKLLVLTFFLGSVIVLVPVLPLQAIAETVFKHGIILLIAWALIEECSKFGVAALVDFRNKSYNEPVDALIYLITVALGFAAFENTLFVIKELGQSGVHVSIMTALIRFVGATLLHVCSSATVGGFVAFGYCLRKREKVILAVLGIAVATGIHTLFNYFILNQTVLEGNGGIITVFLTLWVGVICLLFFFEKIKTITCKS